MVCEYKLLADWRYLCTRLPYDWQREILLAQTHLKAGIVVFGAASLIKSQVKSQTGRCTFMGPSHDTKVHGMNLLKTSLASIRLYHTG